MPDQQRTTRHDATQHSGHATRRSPALPSLCMAFVEPSYHLYVRTAFLCKSCSLPDLHRPLWSVQALLFVLYHDHLFIDKQLADSVRLEIRVPAMALALPQALV